MKRVAWAMQYRPVQTPEKNTIFVSNNKAEEFKVQLNSLLTMAKMIGTYLDHLYDLEKERHVYKFKKDGLTIRLIMKLSDHHQRILEEIEIYTANEKVLDQISKLGSGEKDSLHTMSYNGRHSFISDYENDFVNALIILQKVL